MARFLGAINKRQKLLERTMKLKLQKAIPLSTLRDGLRKHDPPKPEPNPRTLEYMREQARDRAHTAEGGYRVRHPELMVEHMVPRSISHE